MVKNEKDNKKAGMALIHVRREREVSWSSVGL